MTCRWHVRAATRPARRRAKPSSPAKLQPDFVYRKKSGCCVFLKRLMFTTFLKKDKMLYRVVQEYAHRRNIMENQRAIEIVTEDLQAS